MNKKHLILEELHKPARRNYLRRKVDMRGINDTLQCNLVEMIPYAKENKNYKYMLTAINIFSKYAWAIPLKTKSGKEVATAMNTILKIITAPRNLHVDMGKEFYNKDFQDLMVRYKINMSSTYSGLKASICECFNRTLKEKMWKQFSLQGNYKWLDILPD